MCLKIFKGFVFEQSLRKSCDKQENAMQENWQGSYDSGNKGMRDYGITRVREKSFAPE